MKVVVKREENSIIADEVSFAPNFEKLTYYGPLKDTKKAAKAIECMKNNYKKLGSIDFGELAAEGLITLKRNGEDNEIIALTTENRDTSWERIIQFG